MSQIHLGGVLVEVPNMPGRAASVDLRAVTLNATGETLHMVGQIYYSGGYSASSKTISAAGGGKILWLSGAVTFANAGTTFKVGIQDPSAASTPAQGDGAFDVYASFTGGGGGVTASATQTSTMTSGSKTLSHGQAISISFEMTATAGADSILLYCNNPPRGISAWNFPMCSDNTGGSFAKTTAAYPMAIIQFDDSTYGYIFGSQFTSSASGVIDLALDTATADEYGNCFNYPVQLNVVGVVFNALPFTSVAADFEVVLYSDPFGTPVAEKVYVFDSTISASATNGEFSILFSSPFINAPNTNLVAAIRPTVNAQSVRFYRNDMPSEATGETLGFGSKCYSVRRLNNSGPFADYNGGTAKTRYMHISLITDSSGQDSHFAHSQIGM